MTTRRPATVDDTGFLWLVQRQALGNYVSAQFGITEVQQRVYFDEHFSVTNQSIVMLGNEKIGLLSYENRSDHVYLANVAILPAHQSQGIGTQLVAGVLEQAAARGMPVRLQVLKSNVRAQMLYLRLGFDKTGESDNNVLMSWNGGANESEAPAR